MIDITNSLIAFFVFVFSLMYLKIVTSIFYNKKLTSENIFQISARSFINQILGSLELIKIRKYSSSTLVESATTFLIMFNSVTAIFMILTPPLAGIVNLFWIYLGMIVLNFLVYLRYLLETHVIFDQDAFLKNNFINLFTIFLLMLVAQKFTITNVNLNMFFNIVFILISIRTTFNSSGTSSTSKENLLDESLRFIWLIGASFLITGFYVKLTNYYVVGLPLITEAVISLGLLSILTILRRQRSIQTEKRRFDTIVGSELTKVIILCLIRMVLWKY
ncbi:MAG: hypothetical protein ACJAS4_003622 [Bacteriovoracaceae bacterium]|jgi:hypothetical protein